MENYQKKTNRLSYCLNCPLNKMLKMKKTTTIFLKNPSIEYSRKGLCWVQIIFQILEGSFRKIKLL